MERFEDLVVKMERLGLAGFRAAYPHPFLVFVPPKVDVQTKATERLLEVLGIKNAGSQSAARGVGPVAFPVIDGRGGALGVGRGTDCDISIPLPRVSKLHARIHHDELREAWLLEDAGSKNGCTVDGRRVEPGRREEMPSGAAVGLGPYSFRFFEDKAFAELVLSCSGASDAQATAPAPLDEQGRRELFAQAASPSTESGGYLGIAAPLPLGHELIRRLGAGGMAEVLLTKKVGPGGFSKHVALKRMLPEFATDRRLVQMFIQEARVAARINHPNVVQIFELLESSGQWFIAMEFVDGLDLSAVIRAARDAGVSIPLPVVLRVASDLCAGLHAAHTATDDAGQPLGIVHRDISPHNVLIARSGVAKVADFGVSKAADQARKTKTGELKGKLVYMAPEQVDPKLGGVDARTDIFAAGLTLYEMLTFTRPLRRDSEVGSLSAVLRADIQDLRELRPELPADLAGAVMRCLARLPAERFQDASKLHRALEEIAVRHGWVTSPTAYTDFVNGLPDLPLTAKNPKDQTDSQVRTTPVSTPAHKIRRDPT